MESEETQPPDPNQMPFQEERADPWIGQMLSGYHVIRRIGEGGMGIVYLARHQSLDRLAAVKFLGAHMVNDPSYIQRFFQEARAAATLDHPNLVDVYDAGKVGENVYYIIMEYVEGLNLRTLVQQRGKLLVSEAVDYIRQAAAGLGYAHRKQIIHRDVKPDNLMLAADGVIKIGDLGLAKWSGGVDGGMTGTGTVLGTPYYISPEQIRGARDVDARTDVYSLGGTFYHLLTGRIPYEGSSPAVIMAMHLHDPAPDPRKVRPPLDEDICSILQKMMAKKAGDRFQSMEEVEKALIGYQAQSSHPAAKISVPPAFPILPASVPKAPRERHAPPAPPQSPGHWKAALLGAAAALAGLGLLAAIILFALRHQAEENPPPETAESTPAETPPEEKTASSGEELSEPEEAETASMDESKKADDEENAKPPEEKPAAPPAPALVETVVAYDFSRAKSGYLPEGVQCFIVEPAGRNLKVGPSGVALLRGRSSWEVERGDSGSVKNFLSLTTEAPPRLKSYFLGASFYLPPLGKDRSFSVSLKIRSREEGLAVGVLLGPGARQLQNFSAETNWKTFTIPLPADRPPGPGTINVGFRGFGRLEIGEVKVEAPK